MTQSHAAKLRHLAWAIDARARNQRCALRLFATFTEHRTKWTTIRWARAAQNLLAVTFSLWRAAFLAEKTGGRAEVFAAGLEFLEKLIADNAIAYPQDRKSNEWTFNYYTKNAKAALQDLAANWPEIVNPYDDKTRPSMERWDYCQTLLDEAISAFEKELSAASPSSRAQRKRPARKERRKRSRDMTLAAKREQPHEKPS